MLTRRCLQSTLIWEELPLRCCFSMMMARTHGMRCCTNLLLLTVRWSATTGCFIKALKVSSFYRDKKKVSPIKHTRRHTATKRQTHINHAFIFISARLCNCKEPSVGFSWIPLSFFVVFTKHCPVCIQQLPLLQEEFCIFGTPLLLWLCISYTLVVVKLQIQSFAGQHSVSKPTIAMQEYFGLCFYWF